MKFNEKYFKTIVIISFFLFIYCPRLQGVSWSVRPMGFNFNPSSGDTLTKVLTIQNSGNTEEELIIYIKDIQYNTEGNGKELEPGNVDRGMAKWAKIYPEKIILKGGENKQVRFTIIVPEKIEPGSYWANMYAEAVNNPTLLSKSEVRGRKVSIFSNIRYQINLNATIPGNIIKTGEITNVEVIPNVTDTSLVVNTTFENTGDLILKCNGRIEIRDEMGETVETINLGKFRTYPECKRIIKKEIPSSLKLGEYSILVIIDFGGNHRVAGEAFFEIAEEERNIKQKAESKKQKD